MDYTPVVIQAIVSIATIFGGAGFWQYLTAKQSRKSGLEKKVDTLVEDVAELKEDNREAKEYRSFRDEKESARDAMDLSIARTMLLEKYNDCMKKGYYSIEEREVFHALFENYHDAGGDGVIDQTRDKILMLPTEPPKEVV